MGISWNYLRIRARYQEIAPQAFPSVTTACGLAMTALIGRCSFCLGLSGILVDEVVFLIVVLQQLFAADESAELREAFVFVVVLGHQ